MTSPVTSAASSPQPVAAAVAAKATATKGATKVASDSASAETTHVAAGKTQVTISAAGRAAAAANEEAMETPAQTAREAQGSDMQAKRLFAKEQAAAKAAKA